MLFWKRINHGIMKLILDAPLVYGLLKRTLEITPKGFLLVRTDPMKEITHQVGC